MTRAHEQRGTGGGGSPGTWGLPARVRGCIYSVHNGEPFRSVTQTGEEGETETCREIWRWKGLGSVLGGAGERRLGLLPIFQVEHLGGQRCLY